MENTLDKSRVEAELKQFANNKKIHQLPPIQSYWSQQFLAPKFKDLGFAGMWDFYVKSILSVRERIGANRILRIASIGSGNCDIEIELATRLKNAGEAVFHFECLDLNPVMLERGAAAAKAQGLSEHFSFTVTDLTTWNPYLNSVSVFFANQSLHHIVELEALFDKVHYAMADEGCLLTGDMIGRNGHRLWPGALTIVRALWASLDDSKKFNHRSQKIDFEYPNTDFSGEGFEGVRAQDILPLLVERFHQEVFIGFNSISRPFVSRAYGHNFDPQNEADTQFIRFLGNLDDSLISEGYLKPTQCFATFRKVPSPAPTQHKHWTASYCVRKPN